MSCIICGENSAIKMLDELNLASLIIDRDHCILVSGQPFRHFAVDFGFENKISLYSDKIGIFDKEEFYPLIESVFISESPVKQVRIDIEGINGEKKHLNAGFYPLSSCADCRRSVLVIVKDETGSINAYEDINELNRRLHIVNEIISISSSSKDPYVIINEAVRKTVELLNFDAGAFYSLDAGGKKAQISAYHGLYELFFPPCIVEENNIYPFDMVYNLKKPVYSEEYLGTPHDKNELGVFSMGCVPVMAGSEIIGSLNVATSSFHKFTMPEKETLQALGQQIGGIIRLANLQKNLIMANGNANLYLDIMMHDINNANLISSGYLDLMGDLEGKGAVYAKNALCGVEQSISIIKNVSVIRDIRETKLSLSEVSLDSVIKKEISHFPDVNFRYNGCNFTILCDELLSEVFTNLFGNSVKFGGKDVCIDIDVVSRGNFVEVSVSDDGPGIPDEIKPSIFNRFYKGKLNNSGKGLGLSIVRMVLERYQSCISVGDRVKGSYNSGAKFTFMLKKM